MATRMRISRAVVMFVCLLGVLAFAPRIQELSAQDATPSATATETATETVTLPPTWTETPTPVPTDLPTSTETPTETATETLTETPTAIFTETATETSTPESGETASPTATLIETPTETATSEFFTPSPSETATETATATQPAYPPEPPLTLLFTDNFDIGALYLWTLGSGWALVPSESGQALQSTNSEEPVTFVHNTLTDSVIEAKFLFENGAVQMGLRKTGADSYRASLDASGQVSLFRGDQLIQSAVVNPNVTGQWRVLRLSAINDIVRVSIDGAEVIAVHDLNPLPAGTLSFAGMSAGTVQVDDVSLWIPTAGVETPTPTQTAESPTLSPTIPQPLIPPERPLTLVFAENFDVDPTSVWNLSAGWSYVPNAAGLALQTTNSNEPVTFVNHDINDAAIGAQFQINNGAARISLRQSEAGSYAATLSLDGTVTLYRNDAVLGSATVSPVVAGEWHFLRLSVIDGVMRVSVDKYEVLVAQDAAPLPAGTVTLGGVSGSSLLVDNFYLWIPTDQVTVKSAQSSQNFATVNSLGSGAIRSGFDTTPFPGNDDESVGPVPIGFAVKFFNQTYDSLYINNNGNVTFDSPLAEFTPFDLTTTGRVIIAPFFADVDTRIGNVVSYGAGTVNGHPAFGVTWSGVGCYYQNASVQNHFQVILINRSDVNQAADPGAFDVEFNYDQIQWETGQFPVSGGDANCQGGHSARIGYSNGTGNPRTYFELFGSSTNGAFLDSNISTGLIHNSRSSTQPGRYVFQVRNGDPTSCEAKIVLDENHTSVNVRTGPGTNNSLATTLPEGATIVVLGRYQNPGTSYPIWYRIQSTDPNVQWWIGDPDTVSLGDNCSLITPLGPDGNPLTAPTFDYSITEPPSSWLQLSCIDVGTPENWANCARMVLRVYWEQFSLRFGYPPHMSDVLAAVYTNELGSVNNQTFIITAHAPKTYNSPQQLAQETLIANYWSVVITQQGQDCNLHQCDLDPEKIAANYLYQVQSWYSKANYGDFDPDFIAKTLIQQAATNLDVGFAALATNVVTVDNTVPHQWGNYGYGLDGYDSGLINNSSVVYCTTIREFTDKGNPGSADHPPDEWNDYRFVIIKTLSLGFQTSTYGYAARPTWLENLANPPVNSLGEPNYYRNNMPYGNHNRDFLSC